MKNQISALDDDMTTNRVNQFQQHAFRCPRKYLLIYYIGNSCKK